MVAASLSVWLPCLIGAHVFAAFWLLLALKALAPQHWSKLVSLLGVKSKKELPRQKSEELWKEHGAHVHGPTLLLEWEGVGCAYSTSQGARTVLKDVSGAARPYEMLALMGPSGAGKSTLLDILAGRKSVGRLSGSVCVNGVPRGPSFSRHVSYVPQDDNFLPTMTVAETCRFHAALTLPRETPRGQMAARTDEVLAAMGMLHARDTLVGGVLPGGLSLRGLSGGERKRVSVAVGILAAPSIIFLDEPTSGLDSCSALSVVEHLRDRAHDGGLTIVASIHQPRAAVWAAFDTCSMLSGGLLLYSGRCGGIVPWFESIGMGPWRSDVYGTASDWVMDLVNIGFDHKPGTNGGRTISSQADLEAAAAQFAAHQQHARRAAAAGPPPADDGGGKQREESCKDTEMGGSDTRKGRLSRDQLAKAADPELASPGSGASSSQGSSIGGPGAETRRRPSRLSVFRALYWREMLGAIRNPTDVAGRMLLFTFIGVTCGLVFWRMGDGRGLESLHNRINLMFVMALQLMLLPYVYMSLYTADKRYYTADISARLYSPGPYYAAKTLATTPFMVANVLVYTYITYGMTGLRLSPDAMAVVGAASVLLYLVAQQVHCLATILMPNADTAFLITILWSTLNIYFSNFTIRVSDMALTWLAPVRWVSAVYYAFTAFVKGELGPGAGGHRCDKGLLQPDQIALVRSLLPNTGALGSSVVTNTLTNPGADCLVNPGAVLEYYAATAPAFVDLAALLGYLVILHIATFVALVILAKKERR